MARAYKITEVCGDWALHIPPYGKTDAEMILIFNSRSNAELVKSVLEWENAHPNEAVPYKPTLTQPNEWVNRVRELDEMYTKLQIITGFTVEQLLEMFAAGYTLEKHDFSKSFEEMASLAETTPPNEPLTLEQLREMDGEPVWLDVADGVWALVDTDDDCVWLDRGGSIDIYKLTGKVYRRPPEGEKI